MLPQLQQEGGHRLQLVFISGTFLCLLSGILLTLEGFYRRFHKLGLHICVTHWISPSLEGPRNRPPFFAFHCAFRSLASVRGSGGIDLHPRMSVLSFHFPIRWQRLSGNFLLYLPCGTSVRVRLYCLQGKFRGSIKIEGRADSDSQVYYKTKAAIPAEVDFSDARAFDEEDRLKAEQRAQRGEMKERKTPFVQTLKNLVLG